MNDAGPTEKEPQFGEAEHLTSLCGQKDDLEEALDEAFAQMESGHGQPFEEFAEELRARFEARHTRIGAKANECRGDNR